MTAAAAAPVARETDLRSRALDAVLTEQHGPEFAAPPGQDLAVGTYQNARRYPFNDGAPGFNHSGNGRGCNTLTATFTIHELVYDPDGTLRTFRADFEQHCEGVAAALRGTWVFHAA